MKIGLLGTFGYGNLGDEAIQVAMIDAIRFRFPSAQIVGFSLNPEDTLKRHGIVSYPISRVSGIHREDTQSLFQKKFKTWLKNRHANAIMRWVRRIPLELGLIIHTYRYLENLDLLIISGGGPLTDYWGGGGPWSFPYTLFKHGVICRLRGVKFVILSVGAGPINARISGHFFRWMLSLSDYCSLRDEFSRMLIRSIGYKRDIPIYPDLAYSLDIQKYTGNHRSSQEITPSESGKDRKVIAIGPINYFKPGLWPKEDPKIYEDYLSKLHGFCHWLILDKHYVVKFIPGEAHFDQLSIEDLFRLLCIDGLDKHIQRPVVDTSLELLVELSCSDLVVTSRFHGVILSQLCGKPVIGLSYQEKFFELMNAVGQGDYCLPIDRFDLAALKASFTQLEVSGEEITGRTRQIINQYQNKLQEQYEIVFRNT